MTGNFDINSSSLLRVASLRSITLTESVAGTNLLDSLRNEYRTDRDFKSTDAMTLLSAFSLAEATVASSSSEQSDAFPSSPSIDTGASFTFLSLLSSSR